ncbi:MAG: hypothetical protein M3R13_07645 [Armatimonadota bacterium]|nr:hypothetical protein [Armatimonadota bacterium]
MAGVVEGNKQVAIANVDGQFVIDTEERVTMPDDLKGVTLSTVMTNWNVPPEITKAIELLSVHFKAPFSLHSLTGYLPERLIPRFGSPQGRILDGGQYAVIARDIKGTKRPPESSYSLVDMITGQIYANYGSEFRWSSVYVVGRFVFLAPSERGPGKLRVYELNGKLLLQMQYVICG